MDNFTKNSSIWADQPLILAVQACLASRDPQEHDNLAAYLDHHGITLLVHEWSVQGAIELTDKQQHDVAESARVYTAQWMMQQQAFAELSRELDGTSIDWMLLKGEALGRWLYPASRLRMRGDVDILVRRDQRHQAMDLLEAKGYFRTLSTGADLVFSEQQYGRTLANDCHIALDLHWSVSNRKVYAACLDESTVFDSIEELPSPHCLPAPLALMHAVIHRVSHHHEDIRLIWWIDLWLIWQQLDSAEQDRCIRHFAELGLAAALLHETDAMRCWFEPMISSDQREQLLNAVAAGNQLSVHASGWTALTQDLRVQSWPDRLRYLIELLLPPAHYMRQRYRVPHPLTLPWFYLRRLLVGGFKLLRRPQPDKTLG